MHQARYGFAALAAREVEWKSGLSERGFEEEDCEGGGRAEDGTGGAPAILAAFSPTLSPVASSVVSPMHAVRPAATMFASKLDEPPTDRPKWWPSPWTGCLSFVHPLERTNVGTHGVGFLAFATFLVVRIVLAANAAAPHFIDPFTLVQIAAIATTTAVFGSSAMYHASSKSVVGSAYLLSIDRCFVYASVVSSSAADLVVATMGSATPLTACALTSPRLPDPAVPWQTYLDPLLAGAIAIVCVVSVRVTRWPSDTSGQNGFEHPSGFDSRRPGHVLGSFDLTYGVLAGACALGWICSADYELRMFPEGVGATVVSVKAVSAIVAIILRTNDLQETTDAYAMHFPVALRTYIPRSHTLWHVAVFLAAACAIGVREWALSAQFEASAACADSVVRTR